jgi:simple sugar transport system substrate-binding protein
MEQKKLVQEILADMLAGTIQYGESRTVGVRDGYLDFIFDDPGFRDHVPSEIQKRLETFMDDLRAGRIEFTVPQL